MPWRQQFTSPIAPENQCIDISANNTKVIAETCGVTWHKVFAKYTHLTSAPGLNADALRNAELYQNSESLTWLRPVLNLRGQLQSIQ